MAILPNQAPAGPLTQLRGGSSSRSGQRSATYDYSGLEDHIKRQDAVEALRGSKFASLYAGDVAGAVDAGNKVRGLVSRLRSVAPGTDERNPHQLAMPLVTVRSESQSDSGSSGGPEARWDGPGPAPPQPEMPEPWIAPKKPAQKKQPDKVDGVLGGEPGRFMGQV